MLCLGTDFDPTLSHDAQVKAGAANLQRHVENARAYGVPVVVAVNKFASDTPGELAAVREASLAAGALGGAAARRALHACQSRFRVRS